MFFTFGLLAFSIVPWGALLDNAPVDPYTDTTINSPLWWELGWWLPELSALFFVMAIVVGIVSRVGEEVAAKAFIRGVIDFTGPAFLVTLARSVSVVMTNTKTIDTVLHAMEGLVSGSSSATFVILTFVGSLPLSFLVGGGAAGTALTMPVLAPLGDFASVDRALVITTWGAAAGWLQAHRSRQCDPGRRSRPREGGLRSICQVHRAIDGHLVDHCARYAHRWRGRVKAPPAGRNGFDGAASSLPRREREAAAPRMRRRSTGVERREQRGNWIAPERIAVPDLSWCP